MNRVKCIEKNICLMEKKIYSVLAEFKTKKYIKSDEKRANIFSFGCSGGGL